MRRIIACAVAVLVTACGGGGGGDSTPPPQKPPPKAVLVDAQGDSTIAGGTITGLTPNSPPVILQRLLRVQFDDTVSVSNNGVSGTTISQRLNGEAPYTQTLPDYLKNDQAKIVIGNWAINSAVLDKDAATYNGSLVQFVNDVRAAGKIPVLEEPNPTNSPRVVNLQNYVAIMDNVALQMNVALVKQYDYILSLPNWQSMLPDGIHPNDALYAIKAQREYDVIAPIVAQLRG